MGTSSTAQYGARPGSGALGNDPAVDVGDGVAETSTLGVGDGVDVAGDTVGLAVAGATVIVGRGVEVAATDGGTQLSATSA